jgi:hypothetical protein
MVRRKHGYLLMFKCGQGACIGGKRDRTDKESATGLGSDVSIRNQDEVAKSVVRHKAVKRVLCHCKSPLARLVCRGAQAGRPLWFLLYCQIVGRDLMMLQGQSKAMEFMIMQVLAHVLSDLMY